MRNRYTLGEACIALGNIEGKTLTRWIERYNSAHADNPITTSEDPHDLRHRWVTADALAALAEDRGITLADPDAAPRTLADALATIARLKARIADLEALASLRNSAVTRSEPNLRTQPHEQGDLSSARRQAQGFASEAGDLPEGAEIMRSYAERHGIPGMTAVSNAERGVIAITRGTWRVGRNEVHHILTQEQQRAFLAWAQRHQRYQRCEVEACACQRHDEAPAT